MRSFFPTCTRRQSQLTFLLRSFLPSFPSPVRLASAVAPPQFDGLVVFEGGGSDDVLGGVARGAQHDVRVAQQLLHDFLRLQVPYVHLRGREGDSIVQSILVRVFDGGRTL